MPRTQINYPSPQMIRLASETVMTGGLPGTPPPDPQGTHVGEAILHVTWSPADRADATPGFVQVALEVETSYARLALETPNGDGPTTTFLYSPALDRGDLNRMIQALRAARDRAYGKDA